MEEKKIEYISWNEYYAASDKVWNKARDIIRKDNKKSKEKYGITLEIQPAYQTTSQPNIITIVTSPIGTEIEGPLKKVMELMAKKHGVDIKNILVEKPGEITIAGKYATSCNKIVFYAEVLYYDEYKEGWKSDKQSVEKAAEEALKSIEEAVKNLLNATRELYEGLSKKFNF